DHQPCPRSDPRSRPHRGTGAGGHRHRRDRRRRPRRRGGDPRRPAARRRRRPRPRQAVGRQRLPQLRGGHAGAHRRPAQPGQRPARRGRAPRAGPGGPAAGGARNELFLVYQPLVTLETREVTGVEALVRWAHPDRGVIPPDVFVPLAEEAGLIGEVDRWVLAEACANARGWRDAGMMLRVSVNISGRDLDAPGLAGEVTAVLERAGLEPDLLELEVTEGAAVRQSERALATLRHLRERGVSVAIDDFGTGYSILSRLREFPVHRIKIARAFVQEVPPARTEAPLVAAMIGMARALGLAVVGEGVETAEQ